MKQNKALKLCCSMVVKVVIDVGFVVKLLDVMEYVDLNCLKTMAKNDFFLC